MRENGRWVYKTDIQKFFDKIPRESLESEIKRVVSHRSLHDVLVAFSNVEIGDGFAADWQNIIKAAGIQTGLGVRQGMPLSPYFAGILLLKLDRVLEERRFPVIRYVDDIIGFFNSRRECEDFDEFLRHELGKLSLGLGAMDRPDSKTKIFPPDKPAEFVGMEMRFRESGKCYLSVSEKTLERVEARIHEMTNIDNLLQKKITLPFLGARIEAMSRGFIAAYHGADNMSVLKARVRAASAPVVRYVLEDIFGTTMKSLDRKQRRFLGLE